MEEDNPNNLITVIGDENFTDPEATPQTKNEEEEEEEVRQKEKVKNQEVQQRGEMREANQAVVGQSNEIAFFVVGKTGAGKSSLINSLVGKKVAKVSQGPLPVEHKPIEQHEGEVGKHKIKVLLYDTKGLGTPDDDKELVKKFKTEMVKGGNQFFILICQKITDKLDISVKHFAKLLAEELKDDYSLLIRCVFVLTYANQCFDGDEYEDESDDGELNDSAEKRKEEMKMIMAIWSEKFKKEMQMYEVPETIIINMSVCVAGNKKTLALPVTDDWIETLLETCRSTGKEFQDVTGIVQSSRKIGQAIGDEVDDTYTKIVIKHKIGRSIGDYIGWKFGLLASNRMIHQRLLEKLEKKGMLQDD